MHFSALNCKFALQEELITVEFGVTGKRCWFCSFDIFRSSDWTSQTIIAVIAFDWLYVKVLISEDDQHYSRVIMMVLPVN